jgi:hypothetical protein
MRHRLALALAVASCHKAGSPPSARDGDAAPVESIATANGLPGALPEAPTASSAAASALGITSPFETLSGAVRHRFRKTSLMGDELSRLVGASPELARVGGDVSPFDPGDMQFLIRSKAAREDISFTTLPIVWRPEAGADLLVLTGRGKAASFVAAWWLLPGGEYRLASSFVMLGEVTPVALAYKRDEPSLWWTTCWQCPGETGHVSLREDRHVVIVQD